MNKFDLLSGLKYYTKGKKKREIHLCLIPTVVESQELLMIFLRFAFGRNVDKSDLI